MGGYDVKSCAFCGRLFQSFGRVVCPECNGRLDEDFMKVRTYLYDGNDSRNVTEIAEKTGVSEKAVLYLMKEGRLSAKPSVVGGSSLKCAMCGAPITAGKLCPKCLAAWTAEVGAAGKKDDGGHAGVVKTIGKMHTEHR